MLTFIDLNRECTIGDGQSSLGLDSSGTTSAVYRKTAYARLPRQALLMARVHMLSSFFVGALITEPDALNGLYFLFVHV